MTFKKPISFFLPIHQIAVALCLPMVLGVSLGVSKTLYENQRDFIDLRFGVFFHFNMNTFFPGWANDRVDPKLFNPTKLDCRQWAKAAKAAGMRFGLLTTKHHDGFSIWPTRQNPPNEKPPYTIAQSPLSTRDIVKEYCNAFRAEGLLPCLYFSIWDVANGVGTGENWSASRAFVLGQLTELFTNYGEIPFIFLDGWGWDKNFCFAKIPYGEIRDTIKKLQPDCLICVNNGVTSPWQEDAIWWEEPKHIYVYPQNKYPCVQGPTMGKDWFWDESYTNPAHITSLSSLLDHLAKMEPRYCNFVPNCAPNRQGLLDSAVVSRLAEVGKVWKPNTERPALPRQMVNIEHVLSARDCSASSDLPSNPASYAVDGILDLWGDPADPAWQTIVPKSQTLWQSNNGMPQWVQIDLGTIDSIDIFGYLPRQETESFAGSITEFTIQAGTNGTVFSDVATGIWSGIDKNYRTVVFPMTQARYVRLVARGAVDKTGKGACSFATVCEINTGRLNPADTVTTTVSTSCRQTPCSSFGNTANRNGAEVFIVNGNRLVLPALYREKNVSVVLFDLSGKLVRRMTIKKTVAEIGTINESDGIRIAKIHMP